MFRLIILTAVLFISKGYEIICEPSSVCAIDGNATTIVIANKSVTDVVINCIEPNSCKKNGLNLGLIVYSSANSTYINCFGDDSCEEITINLGITPINGLPADFEVSRSKVIISCTGKQSCKGITINNDGIVTNGLDIITPADASVNKGAFMNGLAVCGTKTQCILECGSDVDTCKDAKCYDNCVCQGSACPTKVNERPTPKPTPPPTNTTQNNNNIVPSPIGSPTISPVPTPEPTPSPTDARNTTECTTNGCILTPEANYDVICPPGITSCTIKCTEEGQCQEAVTVIADSDEVTLICSGKGACSTIKVFNTESSEINIIINGETAAQSALVQIDNEKSNLTITVSSQEGFGYGTVICDGNCDVKCLAKDACKDATYECLTTSDECTLTCDTVNNKCPVIQNFGDSSCNTPNCVVTPDGNTRIVALSDVNKLTVVCNEKAGQCKTGGAGLTIFSAALETILLCDNIDSCEDVIINVGKLIGSKVPKGFKESEFSRNGALTLNVNCNNDGGCKGITIYTTSNVNSVINGDGEEALSGATSICDNCGSLEVNCRTFDGCVNSNILCTNSSVCLCNDAFENDIGNDTAVLATTQYPKNSCPPISPDVARQKSITSINNPNNMVYNKIKNGTKIIIPIIIISVLLLVFVPIIIRKYNKSYSVINDNKTTQNNEYILKNENIYKTYQVEME